MYIFLATRYYMYSLFTFDEINCIAVAEAVPASAPIRTPSPAPVTDPALAVDYVEIIFAVLLL